MAAQNLPPPGGVTDLRLETSFQVGDHLVRVTKVSQGRWSVAVDGQALPSVFGTQADAWEAGVREADKLGRPPAR